MNLTLWLFAGATRVNQCVFEGSSATFECRSNSEDVRFNWYNTSSAVNDTQRVQHPRDTVFNGYSLSDTFSKRYSVVNEASVNKITIRPVELSDGGYLVCWKDNVITGTKDVLSIELTVIRKSK